MPVEGVNGILNVESAALHAPQVGVANTNPQHILSVGSNLYVSGDSSDVLTVDGNVVCEGVKVGLIEITPSYDLAAVSNVGNVTSNTIQFTNPDTGIVATGNVTVGSTLTVSGFRITAQAEANDDLEAITLAGADTAQAIHITNATDSVSPFTGALQIGTNTGNNGGLGVAGNVHVGQGMYVTSNLEVGTANLFVDSTTSRVGIGKTDPATALDVDGTVTATAFVGELAASRIAGTLAVTSGGTGTTTSTGTGSVVRSIAPTFTGTTTFSGEVDVNNHLNVTGNTFYTKPTSIHVDSNVVAEYTGPHGREPKEMPLKKFPEIAFDASKYDQNHSTNTYVQAGYTVTASSQRIDDKHAANLYEDNFPVTSQTDTWQTEANMYDLNGDATSDYALGGRNGSYTTLELPHKIKLSYIQIQTRNSDDFGSPIHPKQIFVYGSINGSSWTQVGSHLFTSIPTSPVWQKIDINSTTPYNYFALQVTSVLNNEHRTSICQLRYYGYEEDPPAGDTSVDATFKSVLNTPQTTGANVYTDAKLSSDFTNQVTGPTPVGTAAVHDNTNKYWEMNGQLTSNITVEANTFLEGDQPHAVSVWFNSSNLEANVSNTCVFSVSDQEKLDSVNLDLQSNTWHNLTYAYQGEGGSRVTYLDGRKVAEDQAEDTFGDYPPFAMTGYSQGGYVVSASSQYDADRAPWKAFDGLASTSNPNRWVSDDYYVNGLYTRSPPERHVDVDGNIEDGEWLKIEMPHKLKVGYFEIRANPTTGSQSFRDYAILGSNDDTNWYQVQKVSGLGVGNGLTGGSGGVGTDEVAIVPTGTYKNHAFKYFVFIWHNKANDVNGHVSMGELKLYGHRENDLVRLPDPTNVLKYPHIAMTGPAQRGYVASASSKYDPNYPAWYVFDNNTTTNGNQWISYNGSYNADGTYAGSSSNVTSESSNSWVGEWLQVELPHKIQVSDVQVLRENNDLYGTSRSPNSGAVLGSNNGSSWVYIHSFSNKPHTDYTTTAFTSLGDINASGYYKYLRLVVTKVQNQTTTGNTNGRLASICELQYYGTGVDSIPIQIGGGNIDKVANFRVYDKFVGEDQALEIWDAQKDEFGRAKSSMTLQKGRLGIGTTEPEGRLAVADEPDPTTYGLQEFPPKPLSDSLITHIEGHGIFKVYASVSRTGTNGAVNLFDKKPVADGGSFWLVGNGAGYNTSSGAYEGESGTIYRLGSETSTGQYVTLEMPYPIKLEKYSVGPRSGSNYQTPKDWELWGSNDGLSWTKLHNVIGNAEYVVSVTYDAPQTNYYRHFGFVVTRTIMTGAPSGYDYVSVGELKLFGTREQVTKQSVLHDGQLTLTKSLTVPRIGPALDADDTPRRDRLVVEYNTSTNPTFEGVVRDTSGRGNDGVFYGGASYDATEKAFDTPNATGIIRKNINLPGGNIPLSVSAWFRLIDTTTTTNDTIVCLGPSSAATGGGSFILRVNTDQLRINFEQSSNYTQFNTTIALARWYHVVATYDGGTSASGRKLFIDGVEIAQTSTVGTITGVNLAANPDFAVAMRTDISGYINGYISNFKLYDTALTAEEVKTLYDMGRCDEGHHVVNFSKTRVGIGLGDGEAPRGALDVRGETPFIGPGLVIHQAASGNWGTEGDPANMNGLLLTLEGETGLTTGSSYWNIAAQAPGSGSLLFAHRGKATAFIDINNSGNSLDFTGQHRTFIKDVPFSQAGDLEGLIVSSDQNKYIKISGGIETGSNAIMINESLPVVSLSTTTNDKKCFGVISASEDPEQRSDAYGSFVTPFDKEKGDTRVYINSVGEGAIWVVNTNGSLESGDYITTSSVKGYGQKQDDDILHNYTVAKITMDCDFNPATQPVQQILRSNVIQTYYLGNVHKVKTVPYEFVTTTVGADDTWSNVSVSPSDVTYAEWSNLEANTQNTYTLTYTQTSNVVYDTKYTLTTTANVTESDPWDSVFVDPPDVTYTQYSNLEANTQSSYSLTFTQTTTDEKTPEEWSALESNTQSLYNMVYYQSMEEEVAAEYPGAVAHTRVIDVIENELDEHGQIQWEDHPTETEKAYKIRYLDVSGAQTDEANAVHIAAFVGCTYHCG